VGCKIEIRLIPQRQVEVKPGNGVQPTLASGRARLTPASGRTRLTPASGRARFPVILGTPDRTR